METKERIINSAQSVVKDVGRSQSTGSEIWISNKENRKVVKGKHSGQRVRTETCLKIEMFN